MRKYVVDQLSHLALDGYVVKNHSNHNEWDFLPQLLHHRNSEFPNSIDIYQSSSKEHLEQAVYFSN